MRASENSYSVTTGLGIYPYIYENGRRYQVYREGAYLVPNDGEEIERLDLFHCIFLALLSGKLYIAPLGQGGHRVKQVLDIGTGTGAWAIEMAEYAFLIKLASRKVFCFKLTCWP